LSTQKILITGGSGFLGRHLIHRLAEKNYHSSILTRKETSSAHEFFWNPEKSEIDQNAFHQVDTIIHLAGTNLGEGRWTTGRKKEIINSRVQGATLLFNSLSSRSHSVKTFISASAIGIYGDTGEELIDENHLASNDFLAETCLQWEAAANKFSDIGIRVVILRIGIVLAKDGGALQQLALPVKLFAGTQLGTGKQIMSWIHIDDLCSVFLKTVEDEMMTGVYNAVAPNPVNNKEFLKSLAHVLHRPVWPIAVPSTILKILLGEKSMIVLNGQRVSSIRIQQTGFNFRFVNLESALQNIYK
jgi:uncharacterized protein (TIGR01777 family)